MSCKCQICGKQYKVDLLIPAELWERIKPEGKPEDTGLMCGSCIMKRIEALDEYNALYVTDNIDNIKEAETEESETEEYLDHIKKFVKKGQSNTVKILLDESCDMALVYLNEICLYEGNYWDYHPGCYGIDDFEFDSPRTFAENLVETLVLTTGSLDEFNGTIYIIETGKFNYID